MIVVTDTYMIVVTDNKASTVAEAFLGAVEIWGWPSRVRTDWGGALMMVRSLMEKVRGLNRGESSPLILTGLTVMEDR